jgi:hypothetical protein
MNIYVETLTKINATTNAASGYYRCDLSDLTVRQQLFGVENDIFADPVSYRLLLSAYNAASSDRLFRSDSQLQLEGDYKYMWVVLPEDRQLLNFSYFIFNNAMQKRGWDLMPFRHNARSLEALSPEDATAYFRDSLQARQNMARRISDQHPGTTQAIMFWFHR